MPDQKIEIHRSNWLVPRGYAAITIGNSIYIRKDVEATVDLLAHEYMHVLQWRKHGTFGFLWRYGWMWVRDGFSYRRIDFEEAAREPSEVAYHWARRIHAELPT